MRNVLIALIAAAAVVGSAHAQAPESQPAEAATSQPAREWPAKERALIRDVADMAQAGASRLHPEVVWAGILDADRTEAVSEAFETALAANSEESKRALLRALELQFIHDPDASVLDLLGPELTEHFRDFDWQFGDYPGGPEGPNEQTADIMVDALDLIFPERRANRTRDAVVLRGEATEEVWEYMTNQWTPIPGETTFMLNRHAADSYVRMREQAKKEGVDLVILSSHRLREVAERNAAKSGNPNAVASFSAHSLGLAVDFQMSHGDFESPEISTRPMSGVVHMRESPVHKWLFLRADDFGWFPYQNEPWHWEYNPPGFRETFWQDYPGGAPERDVEAG
ncbi:MAG: D-alanyl-D-alanine carboxypeptidase family protein [Sumerlaeia bacterium]